MLDLNRHIGPLPPPPFASQRSIVADALPALVPPRRIDVPTWAEQERKLSTPNYTGDWVNDFAPYMVEPSRMTTSRRFASVVFCGPARTGKSDALVLNTIGHRVCCNPRDVMVVCPTNTTASLFSQQKIAPVIRQNPAIAARQASGTGADTIYNKRFRGNMMLHIAHPVPAEFAMLEYADVLMTDYDRMPDDVSGEGSPFALAKKRTTNYGSLGMTVAESSPSRPILEADWKPKTPHEAPPATGIVALFNSGTRGRFYWDCPHCGERFEPRFDRLSWEDLGSPGESAKTVVMICEANGCVIEPRFKNELNRAGYWMHETDAGELVPIDDPSVRSTDVASYACEGPVAAMQSWAKIVSTYLTAREKLERTGDETDLKTTVNIDQGRPYLPEAQKEDGEGLSVDYLQGLADEYEVGVAPAETRFMTVEVDIQKRGFVVQVDAWGPELERWLIDRYEIVQPPDTAPGGERDENGNALRAIDPAKYFEDWRVLPPLLAKSYPVDGSDLELVPCAMIIDSGGAKGVTSHAYKFLRQQRKTGNRKRVYLAKGIRNGLTLDYRVRYKKPDETLGKKTSPRDEIRLVFIATDKLKDEISHSLLRKEQGPGKYHLTSELPERVFAEFCAERRTEKRWEKAKNQMPNEAFDCAVYGKALVYLLKADTIDFEHPPAWAAPIANNHWAVRPQGETVERVNKQTPTRRRVRSRGI